MAAADEKTAKTRRPGIFRLGVFLFALAAAVSAAVFLPGFFGLTELNVTAGSMAPELPEGTLVLVRAVEPETVEEGEILSFTAPKGEEGIVTHRVVENRTADRQFITKGDANDTVDLFPIPYENVIGKVVFHLPAAGRFLPAAGSFAGRLVLIGILLAGVALMIRGQNRPDTEE